MKRTTTKDTPATVAAVDCSKYSGLAPDVREPIYTGIDNMRDLAIIAKSIKACGLTCEVVEASEGNIAKVSVYAANRKAS